MTLTRSAFAALALCIAAGVQDASAAEFSAVEIEVIARYYRDLPRDEARRGPRRLPRGIAKNLERGKPLPPGIAKRYLPPELDRALPPAPAGYERIVVAGKVLLVELATQVVHDVLTDVLFR